MLFGSRNVPEEHRVGFSLFIDEWQEFCSSDIAEMVTQGRKFKIRLCVANQTLSQIPAYLQDAITAMRTTICFKLIHSDAADRAHLFPSTKKTVKPEDIEPKVVEWLLAHELRVPIIDTLVSRYLFPIQKQKKNGFIEIKNPGFRPASLLNALLGGKPDELPTITVMEPTMHLNRWLYEGMSTSNTRLPLTSQIIEGFANCGRGFYGNFKNSFKHGKLLSPDIEYPPYLVVKTPDGSLRWMRNRPEHGGEELYLLIFTLRESLKYLAKHPIGKETSQSTHEIAQGLSMLPKRAAWVKSGTDMGVIYTDDASPMVDEAEGQRRLRIIQTQTQAKYCRPKVEFEQEQHRKPQSTINRSEVI